MKQFKIAIFAIAALFLVLIVVKGSDSKETFVEDFDVFMAQVKEDKYFYDDEEWEEKNEELNELLDEQLEIFEEELTEEEKEHIAKEVYTYSLNQHGEDVFRHLEENEDLYMELLRKNLDLVEELGDEFFTHILPELREMAPEIQALTDKLVNRLREKGTMDRLERIFEDFGEDMERLGKEIEARERSKDRSHDADELL